MWRASAQKQTITQLKSMYKKSFFIVEYYVVWLDGCRCCNCITPLCNKQSTSNSLYWLLIPPTPPPNHSSNMTAFRTTWEYIRYQNATDHFEGDQRKAVLCDLRMTTSGLIFWQLEVIVLTTFSIRLSLSPDNAEKILQDIGFFL